METNTMYVIERKIRRELTKMLSSQKSKKIIEMMCDIHDEKRMPMYDMSDIDPNKLYSIIPTHYKEDCLDENSFEVVYFNQITSEIIFVYLEKNTKLHKTGMFSPTIEEYGMILFDDALANTPDEILLLMGFQNKKQIKEFRTRYYNEVRIEPFNWDDVSEE
jgi:hypothetical protein